MRQKLTTFYHNYDTAIWIRVIGTILTSLTNFMVRPFLVLYLYDKLNSSLLLPMIIIGLQPLCGLLVNLFAGNISDRFGRKPVLIVSLLIQTVTLSGYIFAESVWEYAVISILNGIGAALFMPAANAQIADVVPENKRAEVFALLHTALNVGSAGGPLIGVVLFAWNSRIVFLICALSVLAYLILVWIKVPETLPASSRSAAPETGRAKAAFRHGEHKAIYTLTVLALPVSLLYAQVESTLPLHLQTHFLDFKTVYAAMLTFNGLTVILLQLWLAKRTEGLPPYHVVAAAYGMFSLVALGYGFSPYVILLFAVEFLFTIGEMLFGPHIQKVIARIAPIEQRGQYFSIYGMNWQIGRAIGPVAGGWMLEKANGEVMFFVFALLLMASGILQVIQVRSLYGRAARALEKAV